MTLLKGVALGAVLYCATAFPLALGLDLHGDVWAGSCMLWGVICGAFGFVVVLAWEDRRVGL